MLGKTNVIKAMEQDDMLRKVVIQLDLNPKKDEGGDYLSSYVTYNDVNMSNVVKDVDYH